MMAWAWEREGGGRGRDKLSYRSTTNGGAYLVIENDDDVRSYVLRGCMGTLSTTGLPLDDALSRYATTSAFNDVRFDPIRYDELPYLRVSVSLLVNYETCANCRDWIVGVHGIIIEFVGGGAGGEDRGRRRGARRRRHATVHRQVPAGGRARSGMGSRGGGDIADTQVGVYRRGDAAPPVGRALHEVSQLDTSLVVSRVLPSRRIVVGEGGGKRRRR